MVEDKKRKRLVVEEVSDTPKADAASNDSEIEETTEYAKSQTEEKSKPEEVKDAPKETDEKPIAPEPPPQPMKEKVNLRFLILLSALIAIVLGGLVGGIVVFVNGTKEAEPSPIPITETPSPTPKPEAVDKTKYKVNIQNGSGIAGEGSKLEDLLVAKEFEVGTVGNAKSFDFKKTVVQTKSDVDSAFLSALKDVLSDAYSLGEDEKLPESATSDIIVIVGSDKASD